MKFCMYCGCKMEDEDLFCMSCGKSQNDSEKVENKQKITLKHPKIESLKFKTLYKRAFEYSKKSWKAIIGAVAGVAILCCLVMGIKSIVSKSNNDLPEVHYSYLDDTTEVFIDYEMTKEIYPLIYNRLDSIMEFAACTSGGEKVIDISVEIPGFTQKYNKKFKINEQITQFYIHPALLSGDLNLDSGKQAQVILNVVDTETGEELVKDTVPVYLLSIHDIPTGLVKSGWGYNAYDNFLAALSPEDEAISVLIRKAADEMKKITTNYYGEENSSEKMSGYQDYGYEDPAYGTLYQVEALQLAMSDLGVKYIQSNYSSSETDIYMQRMKLPADVLNTQSGLCVETSVYIASALQELDMNAFLIMPPGHCQVAVEAWPNSGVYILLETTVLPISIDKIENTIAVLREDKIKDYITNYNHEGKSCYVLDCGMAKDLGFVKTNN